MSEVPQQAYNPGEIDAGDIPTPRVKFAHNGGRVVNDGLVPAFSVFSQIGRDDQNPKVLIEAPKEVGQPSEPLTFYVLNGPVKKWSWNDAYGVLQSGFEYPHPDQVGHGENPYRTFDYVIGIPDHDQVLPYKLMFYRSGADAAKRINLSLMLEPDGFEGPFQLTITKERKDKGGQTYTYIVPTVDVASVPALEAGKHEETLVGLRRYAGQPEQPSLPAPTTQSYNVPALD